MMIYQIQDTLKVYEPDSNVVSQTQSSDTDSFATNISRAQERNIKPSVTSQPQVKRPLPIPTEKSSIHSEKEIKTDSIKSDSVIIQENYKLFNLFSTISTSDSSIVKPPKKGFSGFNSETTTEYTAPIPLNKNKTFQKGWVLGIGLFTAIVFIVIRIYFQKYLSNIITSLINIQIAEKLMREKNVLIRRVFLLLNINFAVSTTLFIYLLTERVDLKLVFNEHFNKYIYIFIIFIGILLFRYILILFIGKVFDSVKLFRDYLHNTYLINKNLGLYLVPLVISVFYLQKPFSDIIFYISVVLVSMSLLFKYLRAIQIIMKYNVFLFYSILYLCTLEILPALVGLKFVLSLR